MLDQALDECPSKPLRKDGNFDCYCPWPGGAAWKKGCATPSDSKTKSFSSRLKGNVWPFSKFHAMRWVETATGEVLGKIVD